MNEISTPWGSVDIGHEPLMLGELLITDDGVEVEVTNLAPLTFDECPREEEDWGE